MQLPDPRVGTSDADNALNSQNTDAQQKTAAQLLGQLGADPLDCGTQGHSFSPDPNCNSWINPDQNLLPSSLPHQSSIGTNTQSNASVSATISELSTKRPKREIMLARIREKDALIEALLNQLRRSVTSDLSDQEKHDVLVWLDSLQPTSGARDGGSPVGLNIFPTIPGIPSKEEANFNGEVNPTSSIEIDPESKNDR
ncbi:hypothetical protein NP233_g12502 [Leucocoprinus birnbaumii]|uniref:Uncharacterized protein n=1 Tax=Leucocoprinus birnbaumii TaxID=56174 RepID=A0AAD5VEH7_9AGAR|nr:hypothetical protein NP233_g12502 [Leucocoprinus birnbaumii]